MEQKMENDMDIGVIKGLYRDPSRQYLRWALKSITITYIGLFESLGGCIGAT